MSGVLDVVPLVTFMLSMLAPVAVLHIGLRVVRWLVDDLAEVPDD